MLWEMLNAARDLGRVHDIASVLNRYLSVAPRMGSFKLLLRLMVVAYGIRGLIGIWVSLVE